MDQKETYCGYCNDFVKYTENTETRQGIIRDVAYPYEKHIARCHVCDTELDMFNDENLKSLYDAARTANGLISLEKIREIPAMYGVGKRVLSSMLGWGENTFSRYYDGYLPTKPYSEILVRLYKDPLYYDSLLEQNKSVLSPSTYKKSKRTVEETIAVGFVGLDAIMHVASYLLREKYELTSLSLQKLLYYTQAVSIAFLPTPLFANASEAWVNGPVYRELYDIYNDKSEYITQHTDEKSYSEEEKRLLNSVIKHFGCYDGDILRQFTHLEEPWIKARKNLPKDVRSNEKIPLESIKRYFEKIKMQYGMTNPDDMGLYAKKMFDMVHG